MDPSPPLLLAVVGASGGVGASTLALAVGRRLAKQRGSSAVVDLDTERGGLDVSAGVEHLPGHRWEALRGVRGAVPAEEILSALPAEEGCRLLSAGGPGPRGPDGVPEGAVLDVLEALRGAPTAVVLDLPATSPVLPAVVAGGARIVVVVGMQTRRLADADAVVDRILDAAPEGSWGPDLRLVTRGGRLHDDVVDDLVQHLGAAHLHHLPDDPRVRRAAERGLWPGTGRDAIRACADAVVGEPWRALAAS